MSIGERIRKRREELGLTVAQVARKLGKDRTTIYRYESDYIENLPISVLEPLTEILHTTPAYLMGWTVNLTKGQLQKLNEALQNGYVKIEFVDDYEFMDTDINFLVKQQLLEHIPGADAPDNNFDYYKITELGKATLLNQELPAELQSDSDKTVITIGRGGERKTYELSDEDAALVDSFLKRFEKKD